MMSSFCSVAAALYSGAGGRGGDRGRLGDPFRRDALSVPVRYLDKYKVYGGK